MLTVQFTVLGIPCLGRNGGRESDCGWCKDKWSLPWQIIPRVLPEACAGGDKARPGARSTR